MKSILVGLCVAGAALVGTAMAAAIAETAAAESATTVAHWQPQKLNFNYSGFTTLYTCDGLEDKVRDILETFGARKGIKVRATGCSEGQNRPSKFAWVTAEFSSLAPVASEPSSTAAVADPVVKASLGRLASPVTYITNASVPSLITHCLADPVVSVHQADLLAASLREHGISYTLSKLDCAQHTFPLFRDDGVFAVNACKTLQFVKNVMR